MESLYTIFSRSSGVSTDTRAALEGKLFFCLKGPNFDANTFAQEALSKGAIHVVSDNEGYTGNSSITVVPDVLGTLQELARDHRAKFNFPVIGLTGSNGKTTNKELIAAVLARRYRTYATKGNLNNHIGVPITLLGIPLDAEMAVIEIGANAQGEIRLLSSICDPNVGMIINIGKAHLEGFGGLEGVRKGKGELFDHLRSRKEHLAFVNADDPVLMEMAEGMQQKRFGTGPGVDIKGWAVQEHAHSTLSFAYQEGAFHSETIHTQLVGQYNFPNFLAAVCIGRYYGVPHHDIVEALRMYEPTLNRSQLFNKTHNSLILDAYNANPTSMAAALKHFAAMEGANKLAILGHMLELGDDSAIEHQALLDLLKSLSLNAILVGANYGSCNRHGFEWYENAKELLDKLSAEPIKNATILLKGSRMVALEKLVEAL